MSSGPLPADEPEAAGDAGALSSIGSRPGAAGARSGESQRRLRWILPLVALAVGSLLVWLLYATKGAPEPREPEPIIPLVRVALIQPQSLDLQVVAHGTVTPRTESDLVAEVRGRVLEVLPEFVAGGFVREGEALLRLDPREHRLAFERAKASLALRQSEARLAYADLRRRRELRKNGAVSAAELELYESKAAVAAASRDEAQAAVSQAELDLERSELVAPFDGRVRERSVDVGQFVNPGAKVGRIYAVDYAEVRLPIQTDDLAFLEVPVDAAGADALDTPVVLSATLGGVDHSWPARLVRSEGDIDVRTRMMHVVARVDDPYGRKRTDGAVAAAKDAEAGSPELPSAQRAALPAGLFVKAEIAGRTVDDVFVLPLMALREDDRVFVVDGEDRLDVRPVEVLRRTRDHVVVSEGLEAGERIIVSPLRVYSPRMKVRTSLVDAS